MARLLDRIIGHRATLEPLLQAAKAGRLAPTLLFSGPSGIGKRFAARALAQALVCEKPEEALPCGVCGPCTRVEKGASESTFEYAPETAQLKIEQARDILSRLSLQRVGRARVIVIDQAHAMNPQAANALLKALEEPPEGTYFVLVTPLASAVLPTIRSRSQLVRFRPLSQDEITQILGPEADPWIVKSSRGSLDVAQRFQQNREDFQAVEKALDSFLRSAARTLPIDEIARLKDMLKDRAVQEYALGLLQGHLRDALRQQAGLPSDDSPLSALVPTTAALLPDVLGALADLSIELEQDLGRNVDRALALESFAIEWQKAAQITAYHSAQR